MRKLSVDHMLPRASKNALSMYAVPNLATAALPRNSANGRIKMIQYILRVTPSMVDVVM